ncbi:MAG: phosphoglycerate kinase [Deltaproteobacteria bacterium]|nr:phosphoglycerate kinase [Deltaproteobacteria bacterium]
MAVLPLSRVDVRRKRVLLRCDFNVPLAQGKVADPRRITASLPTIEYLIAREAAVVLCSHLGRPREPDPQLSLAPVAAFLGQRLGFEVALAADCVGEAALRMAGALPFGRALMLENLRFHREEEANDPGFAAELAAGKQVYVNDAFGAAHRAHASISAAPRLFPARAAGLLLMREVEMLRAVTEHPARPFVLIVGGAKVSDKVGVFKNLIGRVDAVLVGGAMAQTLLKAQGVEVGRSKVEERALDSARQIVGQLGRAGVELVLPEDFVVAAAPEAGAAARVVAAIAPDMMALDIGPLTAERFIARLSGARTVVWNGPLGYCELPAFAEGSLKVGAWLAGRKDVLSVIGGGDTAAVFDSQPWANGFSHISTGGGATLEYLEGRELPGLSALEL